MSADGTCASSNRSNGCPVLPAVEATGWRAPMRRAVEVVSFGGGAAGGDQARLVGEDDGLGAVAESELGEDPGYVSLHGGLARGEGFGKLGVRQAPAHQGRYLPFTGCY